MHPAAPGIEIEDGLYQGLPTDSKDSLFADAKIGDAYFVADSQQMPFKDGSLSGVFAACLELGTRQKTIHEAYRVLEKGGVLVWQGSVEEDFPIAKGAGFKLVGYEWDLPHKVVPDMNKIVPGDLEAVRECLIRSTLEAGIPRNQQSFEEWPRHCLFQKM